MDLTEAQLSKVRKLFAQANDPACTEAERDAFHAKVCELMTRWDIEAGDLRRPDVASQAIRPHPYRVDAGTARRGAAHVVAEVANLFGGVVTRRRARSGPDVRRSKWDLLVYATERDFRRIELWADHLISQMLCDVARDRPSSAMSYSLGWAARVGKRLRVRFAAARPADLRDRFAVALTSAEDVARAETPDLRQERRAYASSIPDAHLGVAAGARATLPDSELDTPRRSLPASRRASPRLPGLDL